MKNRHFPFTSTCGACGKLLWDWQIRKHFNNAHMPGKTASARAYAQNRSKR